MPTKPNPGRSRPRVLSIAGSDSAGGAGIQADIKVITCLGGYAMTAVTAVTAQDTRQVAGIHAVPPEFVAQQIEMCIADIGLDAAKTGMLSGAPTVRAVAEVLRRHRVAHLVVDPVIFSTSGSRLLDQPGEAALIRELLPLCEVVMPNLTEASRLAGLEVADLSAMRRAAEAIARLGPRSVWIKGGHLAGSPTDLLYDGRDFLELPAERIETKDTHGAGCALSAALATELARGLELHEAARRAKRFITEALRNSLRLGKGRGPTDPLAAAQTLSRRAQDRRNR
ncbi:MAG: bifunctional hydroxymethylpyrimidine kinase/phosphomethylpyrimidine kinase [Candidatus Brocadiia bacterium]